MNAERRAWDEFWKEQSADGSTCLQRAPEPLRCALSQHWRGFAATLPPRARILDLGCGSGAVGHALATCRSDLRVYGVDYAVVERVQGEVYASVNASTAMESLPFENEQFEGAVSQFGFEYSRINDSVTELARVMAPDAPLSLIVHHAEGPIVVDNRRSLLAYHRLLSPKMERHFIAGQHAAVERIASAAVSNMSDPTIELVAQSLRQRVAAPLSMRRKSWRAINEALTPELTLATALDRIAVGQGSLNRWLAPFGSFFEYISACPLEVGQIPFAWCIQARRRKAANITMSRAVAT